MSVFYINFGQNETAKHPTLVGYNTLEWHFFFFFYSLNLKLWRKGSKLGMGTHAFDPSTQETETGRSVLLPLLGLCFVLWFLCFSLILRRVEGCVLPDREHFIFTWLKEKQNPSNHCAFPNLDKIEFTLVICTQNLFWIMRKWWLILSVN